MPCLNRTNKINKIIVFHFHLKHITTTLTLVGILLGCAAKTPEPVPPITAHSQTENKWQCSAKADEAMKNGDMETGLREHARFVADHPKNPLAHYHLGYAFGQMGDIESEIAHYEVAVSLGYTHDEQLFFNLGMAYGELERFNKAVDAFEKVLALTPDSMDALIELSIIYRELGDVNKEQRILNRRLKMEPDNKSIKNRLNKLGKEQNK
jgi:tetratricopeptide (TPR) repeat protein